MLFLAVSGAQTAAAKPATGSLGGALLRSLGRAIQCLLHVLDSALHMLEIFCADSAPLPEAITLQDIQIIDYTKEIQ